jgi:hypothetical protein
MQLEHMVVEVGAGLIMVSLAVKAFSRNHAVGLNTVGKPAKHKTQHA